MPAQHQESKGPRARAGRSRRNWGGTLRAAWASVLIASGSVASAWAEEEPAVLDTGSTATGTNGEEATQSLFDYLSESNAVEQEGSAEGDSSSDNADESDDANASSADDAHGESDNPEPTLEPQGLLPTADQSGVTGKSISIPKGEATIQGMEESFSAQLSTGIATFSVPFALPQGRGKAQPSLGLSYSSGGGHDVAGVGWSVGVPFIARQTDKGIPKYDDQAFFHHEQDRFVFNGGQELVPICTVILAEGSLSCDGALTGVPDLRDEAAAFDEVMPAWSAGWQYFRPRVEGSFLRFFWSPDHRTWRVQDKSGVTMELGAPVGTSGADNALETNPAPPGTNDQIYRWHLSRQFDVYGGMDAPLNAVHYRYQHDAGMAYLSEIYWTPPRENAALAELTDYAHHVRLRYENRTDPTGSYRSGWLIQQRLRLVGVDVASKAFGNSSGAREMVRKYHLAYEAGQHTSLLASVQVEGRCGSTEAPEPVLEGGGESPALPASSCPRLPPMRFEYSHVQGVTADGSPSAATLADSAGNQYEAFHERVIDLGVSPAHSLDEQQTTLMDVSSDGLPDVLVTAAGLYGGAHGVFLNGDAGLAGAFRQDTVSVLGSATAGTIKLSNLNVVPLDVDGDASVDLLHMPLTKQYSVYSLERGSDGKLEWRGRDKEAASTLNANIDFGGDAQFIRVVDVNFDGLVDVVRSTGTELQTYFALGRLPGGDGQFGDGFRLGVEEASLFSDPVRMCLPWSGTSINFEDRDTQLADMNGDGIVDIVRLRRGDVVYWPGRGNGYWGTKDPFACPENTNESGGELAMANSPHYSDIQGVSMRMEDVNGDGLSDLVQVRYDEVDVWLNVDGTGWTDRHIIKGTPKSPSFANRVRLTDINGSGTSDVLWGNANGYRYIDLTGAVRPHLLIKVENGLGKTTQLEYESSASHMLAAARAGKPWQKTMPTVTQVVKRVSELDNLRIAGRPPAHYVTEYTYRDPVFEGRQREFRGFSTTEVRKIGDANSPTSVSVSHFLLGECEDEDPDDGVDNCALPERWRDNPREALKGLPVVTETRDESGTTLSTVHHRYTLRKLYDGLDGRDVRYAFQSGTRTYLYDTGPFVPATANTNGAQTASRCDAATTGIDCVPTVITEDALGAPLADDVSVAVVPRSTAGAATITDATAVDAFGNKLQSIAYGRETGEDEVITSTTLPTLIGHASGWLWRTETSFVSGADHGDLPKQVSVVSYDANGDPVSTATRLNGSMLLDRDIPHDPATTPKQSGGVGGEETVELGRTYYDSYGMPIASAGANLRCSTVEYEADYGYLPTVETIFTRGCTETGNPNTPVQGAGLGLTTQVTTYDSGLGLIIDVANVQQQPSRFVYDGFGRLTAQYAPLPDSNAFATLPSVQVEYFLPDSGHPYHSLIHTQVQDGADVGDSDYLESWALVDGFGRTVATLAEDAVVPVAGDNSSAGVQRWIASGLQEWDAKGAVRRKYLEFYTTSDPFEFDFGSIPPTYYGSQRYDAFGRQLQTYDLDGTVTLRSVYHALSSDAWDAADLQPGQHQGTYLTTTQDGHGRTAQTIERFRAGGIIEERITETQYMPTGQPEVITRRRGSNPSETVTRWFAYDKMGRMVLNVEPHTSVNYALVSTPNAGEDHQANYGTIQAWRYRYNDAGDLVGMSDARGCGANYYYDGAGRLLGEDYFGCSEEHAQYSPPPLTDAAHAIGNSPDRLPAIAGTGLEVLYAYDTYNNPQTGSLDAGADECDPSEADGTWSLGRLTRVQDLASENLTLFDGRGRTTCAARRIMAPWEPSATAQVPDFASRYTPRWYAQNYAYDAADRSTAETTGVQTLQDPTAAASTVFTHYGPRGTIESVTSSYGDGKLINRIDRTADNLVTLIEYGDIAATTTTTTFDDRRRIHTLLTVRAMQGWPESPDPGTQQSVLQDEQFFYDIVGNPIEIRDHRIPEEWPAGAKPVHRKLQYDDLYRVKRIDYEYSTGDDTWESPFKAELDPNFPEDSRRAPPSPHIAFAKRVLWQSYQYDWLGNNAKTDDDAHGFYDRSLGDIDNDAAAPYQLTAASNSNAGLSADGLNRTGQLAATYDEAGHLETLFVQRGAAQDPAPCLGGTTCSQAFRYTWDELGRLQRARRWDVEASTFPTVPTDDESAAAHLRYHYGAGDNRVLKAAVDPQGLERHAVYIFPSLELRGADFDTAAPGDYTRDASTEVGYLFANGVRIARLVNEPLASSQDPQVGGLHVFFELGDHLGSHSLALDKATSELVERSTYQAYGGAESSYRPEKWGAFREDYRFTGKEEDVEVGLVYFGKRYLNTALQRWVSADPLEIHGGGADPNLYAYVSGQALKNVDPIGLEGENASGADAGLSDDQWNQLVQENLVAPSDLSSDGSAETWAVTPSAQAALRGEEAQPTRLEDFQDEDGVVDFEAWSEAQRTPSPDPAPAVPPNEFEKSLVNHMALSLQAPFQMMSPTPPAAPTIPFPEASTTNPFLLTLEVFTLVDSLASLPRLVLSAPSALRAAPVMDAARGDLRAAEAARDAAGQSLKRKHATYAGGHKDGKVVSGCSSNPAGCAEDDIARQLGPDANMTGAKGWRRNKSTGELEWTDIPVCTNCQSKYSPSQFPPGTKADPGGAWEQ